MVPAKSERAWCEGAAEGSDGRSASTASGLPGSPHRGSVVGGLPTQSRHIAANLRRGWRVHGRASHAALRNGTRSGDTLPRRPHIHWLHGSKSGWIEREREIGARIVAVELADDAVPLGALDAARVRTVLLLGHEHNGVPDEVWPLLDPSCLHTHGRHWRQPQRRRCRIPCALSPRWPRLRCYR